MRTILILLIIFCFVDLKTLFSQNDSTTLDKQSYYYFLKDDYKNLKEVVQKQQTLGADSYYSRLRLGILAYNKQQYADAYKNFERALELNDTDTICNEYLYYCYLFSGRQSDAFAFLGQLKNKQKNRHLKSLSGYGLSDIHAGFSYSKGDTILSANNILNYQAIENTRVVFLGLEHYFSSKLRSKFGYTNLRKEGRFYSNLSPSGFNTSIVQNQIYSKITGNILNKIELFSFLHLAFYDESKKEKQKRGASKETSNEAVFGLGVSKNLWKLRFTGNLSLSNFGNSKQYRGEFGITYLPFGNLNLYSVSNLMCQRDSKWGNSYHISQNLGFKITRFFWFEFGIAGGNSFLYTFNNGALLNNSYQIPSLNIYSNIIVLLGQHCKITLSPYHTRYSLYSFDLNQNSKQDRKYSNFKGIAITLSYKK